MVGRSHRRTRGFTLMEVLLSGTIAVTVIGSAYMVYETAQSTSRKDERKANLQQNARAALDMLIWQIRQAGYYQDANPDIGFNAKANRIILGTDTALVIRGNQQLVGYTGFVDTLFGVQPAVNAACPAPPCLVTGTNVYTVGAAQAVTAYNITAVAFQYFDANNLVLAAPLDGVGTGAFATGTLPTNPLQNPLPAPNAPDPLAGSAARDAVRNILVTITAVDNRVSAGPGIGSTPDQVTLSAFVRLRNAN